MRGSRSLPPARSLSRPKLLHIAFFLAMPMRGYAPMHVHIYVYTPACDARLCDPPNPHIPILWVMPGLSLGTCWGKMCFEGKLQNAGGGKKAKQAGDNSSSSSIIASL